MKKITLFVFFSGISVNTQAAWTSVGVLVSSANLTAADPVVWGVQNTLDIGNIGVCVIASDNDGNNTDTDDIVGVTDSAGNTWTSIFESEIDPGAAAAGAVVGLFATKATAQLSAGGTITVDMSASRTAHGLACWEFSVAAGNTFSISGTPVRVDDAGADASTITISGLTNTEHLWIRGIASETTNGAIGTPTTSFSVFTSSTASTGTEATSMGVDGEFIIFTAASLGSDPTMSDTTADRTSVYAALDEVSNRRRPMTVQ
jgi:hypothetical protein